MSVDFFEDQDKARRITGSLIFYFILGLLGITGILCLAIAGLTYLVMAFIPGSWDAWVIRYPGLFLAVLAGCILLFILLCSRWRMVQLRKGGGPAIAEMLGGSLVQSGTESALERRLLDVVDEMAIASGIAVPLVYILQHESGINAFAAGLEPHYAVLGVTRGSLENLDRDELQGLVGHEFSHILNGDMRLNFKLIGWMHGITLIGHTGKWIFYVAADKERVSSSHGEDSSVFVPGLIVGAILMTIGYLGTFFGDVIKASVCRQREYLADASAVEFTRNPSGLAGALKKIGGSAYGAELQTPNAMLASHMFFGQGIIPLFRQLLATHPPLADRILRIDPDWTGNFEEISWILREQIKKRAAEEFTGISFLAEPEITAGTLSAAASKKLTDSLDRSHASYKHQMLASAPKEVFQAARVAPTAPAVVYALLLNEPGQDQQACMTVLSERSDVRTFDLIQRLAPLVEQAGAYMRLPLLDLALAQLKSLDAMAYALFRENVRALIRTDNKMGLFEWVVWNIFRYQFDPRYSESREKDVQEQSLQLLKAHCVTLLEALATVGERDSSMSRRMFARGAELLRLSPAEFRGKQFSLKNVDVALEKLIALKPRTKQRLMAACVVCICENNEVSIAEGELLRVIAVRLECPVPPLLPGQPLV